MRAVVGFLSIQYKLQKVTEEQLERLTGTAISREEYVQIVSGGGEKR